MEEAAVQAAREKQEVVTELQQAVQRVRELTQQLNEETEGRKKRS